MQCHSQRRYRLAGTAGQQRRHSTGVQPHNPKGSKDSPQGQAKVAGEIDRGFMDHCVGHHVLHAFGADG